MITKAMIFAAGRGERMGELTRDTPKPLLLVNNQPLIVYHIKKLAAIGITDCLINLHYLAEKIPEALGDGSQFGLRLHYSYEKEKLETAGGIIYALPFFENQPFILISADVFTDYPFENLLNQASRLYSKEVLAHLVLVENPPHAPLGDFALTPSSLLSLEGEKLNYAGMGIFHPQLFSSYPQGYRKVGEVIRDGIMNKKVSGQGLNSLPRCLDPYTWLNVDNLDRLLMARLCDFDRRNNLL